MRNNKVLIGVVIALFIVIIAMLALLLLPIGGKKQNTNGTTDKTAVFACPDGRSITATFHLPADKNVDLVLSDGRHLSVPHAVSASGARYANGDESFVFWNKGNTAFIEENGTTTYSGCSTEPSQPGVYHNSQYGFEVSYPTDITPTTTFAMFYHLSDRWRATAETQTGTNVVAFPVFRIDHGGVATGQPYPLYFDAEVRIGASKNPQDVADCLKPDPGYTAQQIATTTINNIPFTAFKIESAGMMQYLSGVSYRTVLGNTCFALEQLKTGSSYRDDSMKPGLTDAQLDAYYNEGAQIIKSFRFTPY